MRENLRRRFPEASEDEIDDRLRAWLSERPGAEFGDAEGKPGRWPPAVIHRNESLPSQPRESV